MRRNLKSRAIRSIREKIKNHPTAASSKKLVKHENIMSSRSQKKRLKPILKRKNCTTPKRKSVQFRWPIADIFSAESNGNKIQNPVISDVGQESRTHEIINDGKTNGSFCIGADHNQTALAVRRSKRINSSKKSANREHCKRTCPACFEKK